MVVDPDVIAGSCRGRAPWQKWLRPSWYLAVFRCVGISMLAAIGITAIELMPINDFPGATGGYDGAAPARSFLRSSPDDPG